MKPKKTRNLSVLGAIVFTANTAHAAPVTQTANDTIGNASFVDSARWSNLAAPSAGNTYSTNGWIFRSPASNGNKTFAGDSLSVETKSVASGIGATIITKGTDNQTITFPSLIMNGGIFSQGQAGVTHTLAGNITANATSGFSITDSSDRNLFVSATITGAGRLHVGSFGQYNAAGYTPTAYSSTFAVSGNNSGFSGGWTLGGNYIATNFGGATTYDVRFNSSGITYRLDNVNALGTGDLQIHAGTVNLNGNSPTVSAVTVADAGSATIRTAGSVLTTPSLNLGSTTGATFNIDNGALANPVSAPIASTTFTVNGPSTIGVRGTGLATGTFPLIAHTGAIGGAGGFAGITLSLPPGVSGNLVDNPGSLDVNISGIEFIKWTNGAATGNWNIATDVNWKTATGLVDTTYQQNTSGGHSVLFNESEPEASPVAINIPAAVSPNAISINNPTKDYVFSGQSISGTGALVKSGAGTATFSNTITSTGGITVNGGKLVVSVTPAGSSAAPVAITTATGGTLEYSKATQINQGANLYSGNGTLLKTGAGTLLFDGSNSSIAMAAGGLIDVQAGKIQFGNWNAQSCTGAANQSDMNIASGATFDGYSSNVVVDKLTGSGIYQAGYFGPRSLTIGIAGGSSTFGGTIIGNGVDGNSQTQLIKRGNGTITLTGKVNARGAYGGSSVEVRGGTVGSPSTLILSPSDGTSSTGYTGGGVYISPGNTDVAVLEQTAGTMTGSVIAVGEYGQGTFNLSGGTVNAGRIEFGWNGGGNNGPVVMNISGSSVINVNSNGQILMGQYWGRSVTVNQTGGQVVQFSDTGVTRGGTGKMNFFGGNQNLTWNLENGTLSIAGMGWAPSGSGYGGGNGVLNLKGGLLQITSAAFAAPTGDANGKPKVAAKVYGDDVTPNSGARIDNYGLAVTLAMPIQHGLTGVFDGGLSVETSVPGGSLTLTGINTYTGNTTVPTGNSLILADNAGLTFVVDGLSNNRITGDGSVTLDGDFTLDLTYADITDGNSWNLVNVGTLAETFGANFTINGFTEDGTSGIHTKVEGLNTWTFDESTGTLSLDVAPATGYTLWITDPSFGLALADQDPSDDPDNDGMDNLLEFVLNGDPSVSNPSILPDLAVTGTHFEFTYQRRDDSVSPETTQTFQWGTTLAAWPGSIVVPSTAGTVGVAEVLVTNGSPADTVTVRIPKSEAGSSGKLFGRIMVEK
jgi:autotransporter-associated beta strand protein